MRARYGNRGCDLIAKLAGQRRARRYRHSGRPESHFCLAIEPKFPNLPFTGPDPSKPTVRLLIGSLQILAKSFGGSFEQNTAFIKLVLSGISAINRIWPLSRNPVFYSDRENYIGKENSLAFALPSEDEIAQL